MTLNLTMVFSIAGFVAMGMAIYLFIIREREQALMFYMIMNTSWAIESALSGSFLLTVLFFIFALRAHKNWQDEVNYLRMAEKKKNDMAAFTLNLNENSPPEVDIEALCEKQEAADDNKGSSEDNQG